MSGKKNRHFGVISKPKKKDLTHKHTHPHMPALVMMLKYVILVTGDLSARVLSLLIRKPLQDSPYCWPVSVKFPWFAFK